MLILEKLQTDKQEKASRRAARRAYRIERGLCATCGKAPLEKGHVSCRKCLNKRRTWGHNGHPRLQLEGKRFGMLTVLEFAEMREQHSYWKCRCDCGKINIVGGHNLIAKTRSCGCIHNTYATQGITYQEGSKIGQYKRICARDRGYEWSLTDLEAIKLFHQPCYLCGKKPKTHSLNGIDRIDTNKGYTRANSYPCCRECNTSKGNFSIEKMRKVIEVIDNATQ